MLKFALDTENGIIRIGDKITVHIKGEEKPTTCNLTGVFRSVHPPHEVCLNLSDRPHHMSVCESKIISLQTEPTEPCDWCDDMMEIGKIYRHVPGMSWRFCSHCGRSLIDEAKD